MTSPLADALRPKTLDDVVGQHHILDKGKMLRQLMESARIPNMIFYGPSGVGKTTVASIMAKQAGKKLCKLNGTTASTAQLREVVDQLDTIDGIGGVVLYLDEIQYLNKKQQQTLLEYIENGSVTLIASTTENPYFYIYNAVLSRCTVFEFKPVSPEDVMTAVERGFEAAGQTLEKQLQIEDGVSDVISRGCGGDVRKALNAVELLSLASGDDGAVTVQAARDITQRSAMRYDREGDEHYDMLSALQKSVRGSDENAALHYLARLLEAGDLLSACRRLLVMASEDVGLAYPMAVVIVKSCVDSAIQLGLPEARIPLAQAVVLLATAPKSNSSYMAFDAAAADVKAGKAGPVPRSLQNKHYDGADVEKKGQFYKYPHDYPNHYVKAQYLPDVLAGTVYYHFGENKNETAARLYREKILREAE